MIYTLTLNPAIDRTIVVDEINHIDVTRVKNTRRDAAGKGVNVSKVIHSLESSSVCLGFIAGQNGNYIKAQLDKLGIIHHFVEVNGETRENIKLIEENTGKTLELNETGPIITKQNVSDLYKMLDSLLKENDVLSVSGSVPLGLENTIYKEIINRYKEKGVVVVLDASNELFKVALEAKPHIIKPNKYELEKYLKKPLNSYKEMSLEAKRIIANGVQKVIISLGKDGALYIDSLHSFKVEVPLLKAKSTVGAGDSFVAGLCVGLSRFDNPEDLMRFASGVGSASCLTEGTNPGSLKDVLEIQEHIKIEEIYEEIL